MTMTSWIITKFSKEVHLQVTLRKVQQIELILQSQQPFLNIHKTETNLNPKYIQQENRK
jgi:hypothetical protein